MSKLLPALDEAIRALELQATIAATHGHEERSTRIAISLHTLREWRRTILIPTSRTFRVVMWLGFYLAIVGLLHVLNTVAGWVL